MNLAFTATLLSMAYTIYLVCAIVTYYNFRLAVDDYLGYPTL